jgi:hypothetical protein
VDRCAYCDRPLAMTLELNAEVDAFGCDGGTEYPTSNADGSSSIAGALDLAGAADFAAGAVDFFVDAGFFFVEVDAIQCHT